MTTIERARYDAFHEVSGALSDDAILWRYMDLPKLLSLLEDKAIHFARVDQLADPFEGSVSEPTLQPPDVFVDATGQNPVPLTDDDRRRWFKEIGPQLSLTREHMRKRTWVCCWNHGGRESDALWQRYGDARSAIAVRTTFGRLVRSFGTDPLPPYTDGPCTPTPEQWVFVRPVCYVDYRTERMPLNLLWPVVHKRLAFEYEHEIRTIISTPSDDGPVGRLISVELDKLIEKIIVSPVAPGWFFELVKRVVGRYSSSFTVCQSELAVKPIY